MVHRMEIFSMKPAMRRIIPRMIMGLSLASGRQRRTRIVNPEPGLSAALAWTTLIDASATLAASSVVSSYQWSATHDHMREGAPAPRRSSAAAARKSTLDLDVIEPWVEDLDGDQLQGSGYRDGHQGADDAQQCAPDQHRENCG